MANFCRRERIYRDNREILKYAEYTVTSRNTRGVAPGPVLTVPPSRRVACTRAPCTRPLSPIPSPGTPSRTCPHHPAVLPVPVRPVPALSPVPSPRDPPATHDAPPAPRGPNNKSDLERPVIASSFIVAWRKCFSLFPSSLLVFLCIL